MLIATFMFVDLVVFHSKLNLKDGVEWHFFLVGIVKKAIEQKQ